MEKEIEEMNNYLSERGQIDCKAGQSESCARKKRMHGLVDEVYQSPLSQKITTPFRADLVYLLMKPLEWLFVIILYLFDPAPECRIARQYTAGKSAKNWSEKTYADIRN